MAKEEQHVWILLCVFGDMRDDDRLFGVFSTKEKAEAALKRVCDMQSMSPDDFIIDTSPVD